MSTLTRVSYSLALLVTVAFSAAPARAQFEGTGDQMAQFAPMMEQFAPMMEQFAPMMQRMSSKIGKKRMGQMMQMVAPMVASMMPPGGDMPGMENVMSIFVLKIMKAHAAPSRTRMEDLKSRAGALKRELLGHIHRRHGRENSYKPSVEAYAARYAPPEGRRAWIWTRACPLDTLDRLSRILQ